MTPDILLRSLVSLPTAPFHEERVAAWIVRFAEARGLKWRMDRSGNLLVSPARRAAGHPIVFLAHMDHPGFEVRSARGRTATLEILGGVPKVAPGGRIRLFGPEGGIPSVATHPERQCGRDRLVRVATGGQPAGGAEASAPAPLRVRPPSLPLSPSSRYRMAFSA